MSVRIAFMCATAFGVVVACAPATAPPTAVTFSAVAERVLSNCTTRSCHSSVGHKGGLVLTPDVAYAQLVGVPAENEVAAAKGKRRVVAGDPAASYVLQKLDGPDPNEGALMPQGGDRLSAADRALVRAWIQAGAPR
jgi:hypothetical protein